MPRHTVVSSRSSTIRPPPATYGGAPLRRVFTDATDSDVTADDLVGAGRVVGNWLSSGGKHIVTLCTRLSLMFGGGPNKPLRTLLKSLQCSFCAKPYFGAKTMLPPRDAPADFVLRELFIRSRSCAFCGATRGFKMSSMKKASKAGKAFTSILSGSNCSSQHSAILFITALASLLPDLPAVFIKHDTARALAILTYNIEHQPDANLDFLLAPSHCALAALGQLEIHSISKEILVLNARVSNAETWDSFVGLIRQRALLYNMLFPFLNSPDMDIFTAVLLCAGLTGRGSDFASVALDKWPSNAFLGEQWTEHFDPDHVDVVQRLAHSEDPVLNSMLPAFLLAIREVFIATCHLRIQYDIGKGRTPRKVPRTLDILQSPDLEGFLTTWSELFDREDEEFMEYAWEGWWSDFESDGDTDSFSGEDTEGEEGEMISASSLETQPEDTGFVSAITLPESPDKDSAYDDYVSALSVFGDDAADVNGRDII